MVVLLTLVIGLMLAIYALPAIRLRRALARPFPNGYSRILRKNIPVYSRLPADLQLQLKQRVKQFLHQKKFIGCDGLIVSDEMRVTIAGKASLLLLNRATDVYADLKLILLYPSAFLVPRVHNMPGGVLTHAHQTLSGESWSDGRVILAWDHVQKRGFEVDPKWYDGHDVVLHEFAHQLDSATGYTNGAPALGSKARYRQWSEVMEREFQQLQYAADNQIPTVLDHYGATNPAEFFAVATEAYFEKAFELAAYHPELFEQLRRYFRVDPREWT